MVRERYFAHLCTQMFSSDVPAFTFLVGLLLSPGDTRRFAELLFFLLVLLVVSSHAALTLAFLLRRVLPARLRADDATAVGRALLADWGINLFVTPLLFWAFMSRPDIRAANCPAAQGLGGCGLTFLVTMNMSRSFRPVVAQVPPRLAFAHEVARAGLNAACGLMAYAVDGALGVSQAAAVLARSGGALAFTLVLISLHHDPLFSDAELLPPWLDLWPRRLHPAREAVLRRLAALAARISPMPLDHRVMCGLNVLGNTLAGVIPGVMHNPEAGPLATFSANGRIVLHVYLMLSLTAALSAALSGGGAVTLGEMARRLGMDTERAAADEVRHAVAEAASEEDAMRSAAVALRSALFPQARTLALRIALAGDEMPLTVTLGAEEAVDEDDAAGDVVSSRAFISAQDRCLIADSRDFPAGLATFSDWARAAAAGADVVVTAPLPAGPALLGTLVATFSADAPVHYEQALTRCCRAIGEGLFARRELATSNAVTALASDVFPVHVVQRLLERSRRASDSCASRSSMVSMRSSSRRGSMASVLGAAPAEDAAAAADAPSSPDDLSPPPRPASPLTLPHSADASPDAVPYDGDAMPRDPAAAMRRRLSRRISNPGLSSPVEADLFYSECHECVSVVFVDLVDFTPLAESQGALETMQMLHALFSRYDDLCETLGIYKVETVGDCYMAAAGLLSPSEAGSARRHAAAAALFALRAHAAAAACGLRVRAGVHSGPVTSGLVGRCVPVMVIAACACADQRFIHSATRQPTRALLPFRRHSQHGCKAGGCRRAGLRAAVALLLAPGRPARRAEPARAPAAAQGQG